MATIEHAIRGKSSKARQKAKKRRLAKESLANFTLNTTDDMKAAIEFLFDYLELREE
jgi:hypothetical protein